MEGLELPALGVSFHNVAPSYVPGTPVECRYTLPSPSHWRSKDWIGLFKVGWRSVREYHTFVWSPSPRRHGERPLAESSVRFEAGYLPSDSPTLYQFCYIDGQGTCLGSSSPFTFCLPGDSEELVLLDDVGSSSDMVLVMTRTSLLETQLAESEKSREQLAEIRKQLDREVQRLRAQVQELEVSTEVADEERCQIRKECQSLQEQSSRAAANCRQLRREQEESAGRMRALEADARTLRETVQEREAALERARDSVRDLEGERAEWTQRLRDTAEAQSLIQERYKGAREELRQAKEQLASSRRREEALRQELMEVTGGREEAQARWREAGDLQKQLLEVEREKVLRLSAELLRWRSEAQESETELQCVRQELGRERDRSRIQLSEAVREKKELRSGLQVLQKEKQVLQREIQEVLENVRSLEQKLQQETQRREKEVRINQDGTVDQTDTSRTTPPRGRETRPRSSRASRTGTQVVVSQPAAEGSYLPGERHLELECLERQGQDNVANSTRAKSREGLESKTDTDMRTGQPVVSEGGLEGTLPDVPTGAVGKECPICRQLFPEGYGKEAMDRHVDSHFFLSTTDPFIFQ